MRLVYFLLRICTVAALIVISPCAVTHPLRYRHLHTAFQVFSHIVWCVAICYRSIIAILSCSSTLKNFVYFLIHVFSLGIYHNSRFHTPYMFSADFCFFPGAAISLERASSYVFIGHISLCRQLSQGHRHHHEGAVVTTVHTSSIGKTN
jgi:hypothetical protein